VAHDYPVLLQIAAGQATASPIRSLMSSEVLLPASLLKIARMLPITPPARRPSAAISLNPPSLHRDRALGDQSSASLHRQTLSSPIGPLPTAAITCLRQGIPIEQVHSHSLAPIICWCQRWDLPAGSRVA